MDPKLAIIDWGIGGLGVYKKVKEQLGGLSVTYFSDTGATPYGKMSRPDLVKRLDGVIAFLADRGVTHVVIGCNAASTTVDFLDHKKMRIEGVIDSAVAATVRQKPGRLGLIGGRRTVLSGAYRRAFGAAGVTVRQRIAQPLSALIESGDTSSEKLKSECRKILAPLKNSSHILLACTHYPAITPVLAECVADGTVFIDPAGELVSRIAKWKLGGSGEDVFYTTGDPRQMAKAAANAFGVNIEKATVVAI